MAGPTVRTYKAGSIIYFIEDRGDDIYVLQKGNVSLISRSLDDKTELKENVRKGEFFGVKSALGQYPREETAQVLSDSFVLVFSHAQFEAMGLKNTRIVLQMLKVFSANLRKVHSKVREILGEMSQDENSIELIKVAEYYYKQHELDTAKYGYEAYLRHYPQGLLVNRANTMLQNISQGNAYPIDAVLIEEEIDSLRAAAASGAPAPQVAAPVPAVGAAVGVQAAPPAAEAPPLDDLSLETEPPPLDDLSLDGDLDMGGLDDPL